MKKPFKDPDRMIRTLYQEGKLIKVQKGVYRYDPNYEGKGYDETFSPEIKEAIFKRDNYKCVYCGHGIKEGEELHADHIKPRSKGGKSTLENGQTLCSRHNMLKKNLNQTETGKKMFIKIYELSKQEGHEHTRKLAKEVLDVCEKSNINGHIIWEE
ncbi:HNH endonuclease [Cyanothece sp. BG0011]|uniref:HNH endonuclease n=1 Tax=Cyanothece sp. BG0011 TaxID=2082950 RepID=UPI0018E4F37B|nr:HNH endonuclease [Cyanothece sp. BG0011]